MSYTIEYVNYGITISGQIPVGDIAFVAKLGESRGFDLCDALISDKLPGVTMVMTNEELGDKWRRDLGLIKNSISESLGESGNDALYSEWDEPYLRSIVSKDSKDLRQTFEVLDVVRDWQLFAEKEVTRLGQWNLRLRAVLERVQWDRQDGVCIQCEECPANGHEENCGIGQALRGEPR